MGAHAGPNIPLDGLTLYLDAANSDSYPGSGTTWFDLSGNANHMTLFNNPIYTGSVFQFDGIDEYGTVAGLNYSASSFTIFGASRYTGDIRGRVITSVSSNWLLGHWGNRVERYFAGAWVYDTGATTDNNWRIYTATEDYTNDLRSFYVNNTAKVINSTAGSLGFNGISLGRWSTGSEYSTCEVAFVLVYNRILSSSEISQTYNALKGRFSL